MSLSFLLWVTSFCLVNGAKFYHTVWLPAGKLIRLPCKLRALQKTDSLEWWIWRNADLKLNFTSNSVAAWHDRMGNLIHVGEVLLIQVPSFEASELSITQHVPRETAPDEEPMSLVPEYKQSIGGTHQLLQAQHMDSVTCSELQTGTVVGRQDRWGQFERVTHIGTQIYFTFRIYAQPIIIWNYAVPPEIEFENRSVLAKPITEWCQQQRSILKGVSQICHVVYEQRMAFTRLSDPTETMPLVQSTALGYTELGVLIDLTNPPLNLLANPTNDELGFVHAKLKHSLDMYILEDIAKQMNIEEVEESVTVATRLKVICPPGSHTYMPVPTLKNLNMDSIVNNTLRESSAAKLIPFQMLCHPCAEGEAPRAPYGFDNCHDCPRGYYLGSTGWPSSAGCLPCPEGFTTDRVGATSINECKLNAGAVTRWTLGYLLHLWFELERVIVGEAGPETETRALGRHQQSAWAWLGRTGIKLWICGSIYFLAIFWLTAMAVYRLHLYFRLQSIFKKQYRLLLKAALIGQINLVSHIKQRAKQSALATKIDKS